MSSTTKKVSGRVLVVWLMVGKTFFHFLFLCLNMSTRCDKEIGRVYVKFVPFCKTSRVLSSILLSCCSGAVPSST